MKSKVCLFFFSLLYLFLLLNSNVAQDQKKITEINKKIQELSLKIGGCGDDYGCIENIMKELENYARELQQVQGSSSIPNNSYPPIINKIINSTMQANNSLAADPNGNCEKVNNITKDIVKDIFSVYMSGIKDTLPSPYPIYITYCQEAFFKVKESGTFEIEGAYLDYEITMTNEGPWMARYKVDISGGTGAEVDLHLLHTKPNTTNVSVTNYNGWEIVSDGERTWKSPLNSYTFPSDFNGGPIGVSIAPYDYDSTEGFTTYMITTSASEAHFYPAYNPDDGYISSCGHSPEIVISRKELGEAISNGRLHKVIRDTTTYCTVKFDIEIEFPALGCEGIAATKGAAALDGECIDHGGFVIASGKSLFINKKAVARVGDQALCLQHGITEIIENPQVNVSSGKKRIARVGDKTACGAVILGGSHNTFVGVK